MVNALGQQASARQAGGPDVQGSPDDVIEGEFTNHKSSGEGLGEGAALPNVPSHPRYSERP